ncbi:Zn-ribbon domain-containing OB-fold protein [Hoyosella altamirensis]|uniref:DNA-binding protein n=1 Tax=Hoyosella altamirensis TaxID=616997 RepID=A0A839RRU8_9ACTN|nr:Zn-ribbon domain-containing OB-fold protein [Hoyosella altamirensis]MBB3039270.1 hypothetical protein [Hoyosella altamirensis]
MTASLPEPVSLMPSPFRMEYTYVAGEGRSLFLRGLASKRFLARQCPSCAQTYLPPPEFCSRCLTRLGAPYELDGRGEISTFCIISFPFPGQAYEPPYVVAHISVHGTGTRLMHLIREVSANDVQIGMEVEPVWVPDNELAPSLASIRYFRPVTDSSEVSR